MTHANDVTRRAYNVVADAYADHITGTAGEESLELAAITYFAQLLPEPRRVLDAGCGAGRMLPYLADLGCEPQGVDLSPEMLRRARQDFPGYTLVEGALTNLEYADATFDGVFSWYSTVHSPDADVAVMLGEMRRVVRPGGYVLVAFQSGTDKRRVGEGFRKLGLEVEMYRYHRTLDDVAQLMTGAGLDVVVRLERAAVASEADPQAVVIARRSTR